MTTNPKTGKPVTKRRLTPNQIRARKAAATRAKNKAAAALTAVAVKPKPRARKICDQCTKALTVGSQLTSHCEGFDFKTGLYNKGCYCKCQNGRRRSLGPSCWIQGCKKWSNLSETPWGVFCPDHVAEYLRKVEDRFPWLKWYRSVTKIKFTPPPSLAKKEVEARKLNRELGAEALKTLQLIEKMGT